VLQKVSPASWFEVSDEKETKPTLHNDSYEREPRSTKWFHNPPSLDSSPRLFRVRCVKRFPCVENSLPPDSLLRP